MQNFTRFSEVELLDEDHWQEQEDLYNILKYEINVPNKITGTFKDYEAQQD